MSINSSPCFLSFRGLRRTQKLPENIGVGSFFSYLFPLTVSPPCSVSQSVVWVIFCFIFVMIGVYFFLKRVLQVITFHHVIFQKSEKVQFGLVQVNCKILWFEPTPSILEKIVHIFIAEKNGQHLLVSLKIKTSPCMRLGLGFSTLKIINTSKERFLFYLDTMICVFHACPISFHDPRFPPFP